MSTRHLEIPDDMIEGSTRYHAATINKFHKATDSQMFGALQAIIAAGGGAGVLPWPDTATAFPANTSLKVTAAAGLSASIAAGAAITSHSVYEAIWLQQRVAYALTGLPANRGAGNPIYVFVAAEIQPAPVTPDIETPGNDSRETSVPEFVTSDLDTMDGGVLLAAIQTNANSVTQVDDLRRALEFSSTGGSGSAWRTGNGVPSNALGSDGDFYLNSTTGDFYKKASGAYALQGNLKGATGAAGTNGTNGTNGTDGQDGEDGATWLSGAGVPDDENGNDGDWYLNTSNGAAYQKAAGAWTFQFNLTGPQGIPGGVLNWIEAGWQSGEDYEVNDGLAHGDPASSYRATVAHTSGATTEPGVGADWQDVWMVTAAAGATGATGASGTMWHSGTVAPGSGLGADGAFYLNTATADIYKKISGAWVFQVNIKGAGVPTGGDVGNALVKTGAGDYATGWATPTALVTGIGVGGVLSGSLPNPGFAVDMATQSELDAVAAAKQSLSEKGEPDGYAELDGTGKVPTSQLPAFVDDVIEAANFAALPGTGESGKIYVTLDDNKTFRWSGSAYTEISASLALGETSATAYRGDRGKTAYDHSQETNANPHATKFNQLSDAPHAYTGHGEKLVAVKADETGVEFVDAPAGGGGAGGHVIQDDGTPQTARANLNFFGAGVLVSDNAADDSTDIEIPAGLGSGVAAKISVKITANQNAVNNTPKNIAFDVQEYSTGDGFSWSSGDPTKITATESFDCLAVGTVEFDANGSGVRMVDITKNGSTMVSQRQQAASTDQTNVTLSDIFSVAAGDYVQLSVKQNSGGALDIRDVSRLRLVRIAPVQTPGTVEFASQAEAEAGTDETKSMNPLRTAQAIAALGGGGGGNAETIQGRAMAATAPEDGQAIVWDDGASTWKPGTVSGGGGSGLTENRFKVLTFTNAPAPMEFGIGIGAGVQPVVLRGDMNAAEIKAAFEASSDLSGYTVGVKGETSTEGAIAPGVQEVQTYTFSSFFAMDGLAVGFNTSSFYDVGSATNYGTGAVDKTAIQNGLNALPEFSSNNVTVTGTISYNTGTSEYNGTLILTFANTAPVASLVKLINPMMMSEMGDFTRTTTGAAPAPTINTGDDGELLYSGQFTVFLTGSTPYPAWGIAKNGEVQSFVVEAGDDGNYTLNGGANFTLGDAEALQINQRAIGGDYASVVVKGSAVSGIGSDVTSPGQFAGTQGTLTDDNLSTAAGWGGATENYADFDLGAATTLVGIGLTVGPFSGGYSGPGELRIYGKNTAFSGGGAGGGTLVKSFTGLSPWDYPKETRAPLLFDAPVTYRYYRYYATSASSSVTFYTYDLELLGVGEFAGDFNSYFPFDAGNVANPAATGTGAAVSTITQGESDSEIVTTGDVEIDELLWAAIL